MPTADEIARLRAEAAKLRARSDDAFDRGDAPGGLALLERAMVREEAAAMMAASTDVPRRRMMGRMDVSRELKISRSKSETRPPEVEALAKVGLTPKQAADVAGTTRDMLKQAWAQGKQFRPIRPEWAKKLAAKGVPLSTWRTK